MDELNFSAYDSDAPEKYKKLGRECRLVTMTYYPRKLSVTEFADEIKEGIDHFVANMLHLDIKYGWAEDWMELFQAWSEMEKGYFD